MRINLHNNFFKKLINLIIFFLLIPLSSYADFDLKSFLESSKEVRQMNNFGTEFYLTIPPAYFKENTNNITIKLYVFSYNDTKVKIKVDAKAFTETAMVYAFNETVFDVLPEIIFPFTSTSTLPISDEEIYKKSALHVTSDYPVAVYVEVSGNLQDEGYLGIPVSSLGHEYVLESYIDPTSQIQSPINYPAMAGIVNPFDGNKISVILSNNLKGKIFQSDTISRVLEEGDTWFISLKGKIGDLSGIKVLSDKPIGVITANQKATVPVSIEPNNYLIEQELPTHTWGHVYHINRQITRSANPIIRIYSNEDNSEIYLNGQLQTTLRSTSNTAEYLELRPTVTIPKGLEVISSNKPISVSLFYTGYGDEQSNTDFFKPSRVNLVPFEQYSGTLLFNVPKYTLETEKSEVYLYLVTQLNQDGSLPDDLELGSFTNQNLVWNKVNSLSILDKKEFKYQFNGKRFAQVILRINKSGNYKLKCNSQLAAYIFGSNEQGSFAFPAGMPQRNLISEDKTPPVPTYVQSCDGSVIGTTIDYTGNTGDLANLIDPIFHSNVSYNYEKDFGKIVPGITNSMNWSLKVRDKNLNALAVISFRDYAGNDTTISIEYFAPKLTIQPSVVNFGNTKAGVESFQTITVINNSDTTYKIKDINFKYPESGFKLSSNFNEFSLPPKSQKDIQLSFISQKTGFFEDSVGLNNDCFTAFKAKLIAKTGAPKIMTTDISFNDISLPNSETKYSTVTNVGENDLTITNWKLSDNVNFSVNFGREITPANPLIIEPNKSFTFEVIFKPQSEKTFSENLIFSSDAQLMDSICYLNAKAILPGIETTSYEWSDIRYDNSQNPKEYKVENAIKVKNSGKANITITSISIESGSINNGNFKIDYSQLVGRTLKPNEVFDLSATFLPKTLGLNKLILKFQSNLNTQNFSTLSAFVVVPKVKQTDNVLDFDTTLVNYLSQENSRLLEISNLSVLDWEYADKLKILEIKPQNPELVDIDEQSQSAPFVMNLSNIKLPYELLPGEKLSIPISFSAKDTGLVQTKLYIKTDAINESEVILKGFGADKFISLSNLELSNCINQPIIGECLLRNNSIQKIEIEKLYFETNDSDFKILGDYSAGLTLLPSETKRIEVQYFPSGLSSKNNKLFGLIKGEKIPSLSSVITGKTNHYTISSFISPVSQTAKIDDDVNLKILFEDNPKLSEFITDKLNISVNYEGNFLKLDPNAVKLSKNFEGKFKISNINIDKILGTASFDLVSLQSQYQITKGELLSLQFHTYFPTNGLQNGQISITMTAENSPCFDIETTSGNLILNQSCEGNLRNISISSNDFQIEGLEENPITESKEVGIEIAFNGLTEVSIYNQLGIMCSRPIYRYLSKGKYTFHFDITELSSGIYFMIFKSSDFSTTKKFIIEK